jgi:hypothetical protein
MRDTEENPTPRGQGSGAGCPSDQGHPHYSPGPRWPLTPRIGFLIEGSSHNGFVLRFAARQPWSRRWEPRLSLEMWIDGEFATSRDIPLSEAVADHQLKEALRLLLHASDRTIRSRGFGGFVMAGTDNPCPICASTRPPPGVARGCVISELVVCRGEPTPGFTPVAAVINCRCPGQLFLFGEPATSRFVAAAGTALKPPSNSSVDELTP